MRGAGFEVLDAMDLHLNADAASVGESATFAPRARNSSARPRVRLYTVKLWPALIRSRAIAEPMLPRPAKPTFTSGSSIDALPTTVVPWRRTVHMRATDRMESTIAARLAG